MKKPTHKSTHQHHGFTLIELLVVISIIAILAAMLLPVLSSVKKKAQIRRASMEIGQIVTAINSYEAQYSRFPVTTGVMQAAAATGDDFTYGTTGTFGKETPPTSPIKDSSGNPVDIRSPSSFNPGPYQTNNAEVMAVLLDLETYGNGMVTVNKDHVKNPQRNAFLTANTTSIPNAPGIGPDGVYRDPWGNPYIISIDVNNDEKCRDAVYCNGQVSQIPNSNPPQGFNGMVPTRIPVGTVYEANTKVMVWSAGPDGRVDLKAPANQGANKDNILSWKQ